MSVCFHVVFSAVNWSEGTAAALDLDNSPHSRPNSPRSVSSAFIPAQAPGPCTPTAQRMEFSRVEVEALEFTCARAPFSIACLPSSSEFPLASFQQSVRKL